MIAAALVLAAALSDIVGWCAARLARPSDRLAPIVPIALAVWAVIAGACGVVVFGPLGVVLGIVALLWPTLTARWPAAAIGFLALVAAAVVSAPWLPIWVPAVDFAYVAGSGSMPASPTRILTIVAVATFLGLSANLVCRGALARARVTEAPTLVSERTKRPAEQPSPKLTFAEALHRRWAPPAPRPQELRGGRLIGPLERWLIVALSVVGTQGIIGALMAAKGIVRFPEISKNSGEGSKAEEFLVGSLISWGLAGAGAALIAVSA